MGIGKKVQAVKAERGVSFIEARRIVTTEQRVESGTRTQPMAAVVRASGGQQRPTIRSTCTQTNLTWPDNQEAPTLIYTSASASASSQTKSPQWAPSQTSAKSGRHEEGRSPPRPPRKSPNSRKRQTSAHDRPLGARPKMKRPQGSNLLIVGPPLTDSMLYRRTWRAGPPQIRTSVTCHTS